ncbi:MAG TPA: hypothetical protein PKA02_02485 [Candidatus Saccharibacteria bacterium]|nr:hypothetical protein [Candidatus Saccharibacteria bacterium]
MTEAQRFSQPETEVTEARFVKALAVIGLVVGSVLEVAGINEAKGNGITIEAASTFIIGLAVDAASVASFFAAGQRGRAAAAQIQQEQQPQQ